MKLVLTLLIAFAILLTVVLVFGPREPVDREVAFKADLLGENLDLWLAEQEAGVPSLRPGVEKRILWAGEAGQKTPLSIVYLHGFSATSEEIRPVPDKVAEALGANLYFARLSGHGQDGASLAQARAGEWIEDAAEALEIGRRLGERVLVMGTSTGGTLAALVAADRELSRDVAGIVLVSPNFGLANPAARLLALPWARQWVPLVAGEERSFEIRNEDHAAYWTSSYPTIATIPVIALVRHVAGLDLAAAQMPALFIYSEHDQVVAPGKTHEAAARWGGPVEQELRVMGAEDDPGSHVIAGDILSPGQTEETAKIIANWAKEL
ncbi:alpha/beta hydrolase [Aliiruegeria lutimaris]|uniref:Esterase/lipase n=1 Tax=Aliiruegeria lutimaris TaxID=571298 RepID=A0A1G8JUY9_9RHOB|nr:alpha/beta fold hydrolase [Aliiruegeria lutimaris]SDI35022.1 Esterase/lipase [Aliiruegeria lutimaris]